MAIATPQKLDLVRDHDKPRIMGVAPSTFQVVFYVDDSLGPADLDSVKVKFGFAGS